MHALIHKSVVVSVSENTHPASSSMRWVDIGERKVDRGDIYDETSDQFIPGSYGNFLSMEQSERPEQRRLTRLLDRHARLRDLNLPT